MAKQRRDYGSGSVYQRASDGRWVGSISAGFDKSGNRRRITVTATSESKAKQKLNDKLVEYHAGEVSDADTRTTVKAWAEQWLGPRRYTHAGSTYNTDRAAIYQWIIPIIGHRRISDLAPSDAQRIIQRQREAGLSEGSRRRYHATLVKMLDDAQAEGHRIKPAVLAMDRPSAGTNDRRDMTPQEAMAVLEVASNQMAGSRWLAALLQGLRQAEALGLTWDAVDFEHGFIDVAWQLKPLAYVEKRNRRSGFHIPDGCEVRQVRDRWHLVRKTKTKAGNRIIPLVPWMRSALLAWRENAPANEHGLIWYRDSGDFQKMDDRAWYALQAEAGVSRPDRDNGCYTIHETRHTTANLLMEAGVDHSVIIAILGHSTFLSTRAYLHVKQEPLYDALSKVADRLALPMA